MYLLSSPAAAWLQGEWNGDQRVRHPSAPACRSLWLETHFRGKTGTISFWYSVNFFFLLYSLPKSLHNNTEVSNYFFGLVLWAESLTLIVWQRQSKLQRTCGALTAPANKMSHKTDSLRSENVVGYRVTLEWGSASVVIVKTTVVVKLLKYCLDFRA